MLEMLAVRCVPYVGKPIVHGPALGLVEGDLQAL
jgi:hypothetical protein